MIETIKKLIMKAKNSPKLKGQCSTSIGVFEYYETPEGWRWRLVAANGQFIAHGGEAYSTKQKVLEAIDRVIDYSSTVKEDREDKMMVRSDPKREAILKGKGTVIKQVDY